MSNELKGISGIDKAVNALVNDIDVRKQELVIELSELSNIVTTDETLPARKTDRAEINKKRAAFDRERIDLEKKWKSAIGPVSAAYKACVAECDKVIEQIDKDLSAFEKKRIEAKQALIHQIYVSVEEPDEIIGWYELDELYQKKWENAGTTEKQIRKEIEDAIASLKISYDTVVSLHHKYQEDGLKVLRQTKNLQEAIAKMNALAEQEAIILERQEEERRKAEVARIKAEQEAEEAKKLQYEKPAVIDAPPVHPDDLADTQKQIAEACEPFAADDPFGPAEDIPQTPFGPEEEFPFGKPAENEYIVHVHVESKEALDFLEGMLIGLYEFTTERI